MPANARAHGFAKTEPTHLEVLRKAEASSGLNEVQYMHFVPIVARPYAERPRRVTLPGERIARPLDSTLMAAVRRHGESP